MLHRNKIIHTLAILALLSGGLLWGQQRMQGSSTGLPVMGGRPYCPVAVEFISPVITEFVPNQPYHECWEIIIEASINQNVLPNSQVGVLESFMPTAPGMVLPLPTDVNLDGIPGDPNPFFPDLKVYLDEPLFVMGVTLPPNTNIASLFHKAGSEMELDKTQTTTFAMTVDPTLVSIIDSNGDNLATLSTRIRQAKDSVTFQLGTATANMGYMEPAEPPTISFFTPDWISAVASHPATQWALGIEVRIPAFIDGFTAFARDPIPGPWMPPMGMIPQIQTGFTSDPPTPGMGNTNFPTLELVFSDDFMHAPSGQMFTGGTISGSLTGSPANLRVTGQNLATLIQEVGVTYWYGVNGMPDDPGFPSQWDDEIIYRFVFIVEGMIFDTDVMPNEMIATAAIVTTQGMSSITNVRIKHTEEFFTPEPE